MRELVFINNIDKEYGAGKNICKALNNVSLTINEGDFIGIMGPSGSGKSTLLNMIATIDKPTRGKIIIGNKKIAELTEGELCKFRRESIGFIYQNCNLLDTLTIRDNILAPLNLAGINKGKSDERVVSLANKMNIIDILDKYPSECSGGERQRAAACRALVMNPKIIVADEPTGALDSKNSSEILKILSNLNKNEGISIVMVTHDPMIASYSKTLIMIRDGSIDKIMEKGETDQIEFYYKIVNETSKENIELLRK